MRLLPGRVRLAVFRRSYPDRGGFVKDLTWGQVLSVDVDEIDEDHKKLILLFNSLIHALRDSEPQAYVVAVLEELINCTVWHFSHEERLMLKYHYADYELHKNEHTELIVSAREMQNKTVQSEQFLTENQVIFLERWLTEHMLTLDKKLGEFLCQEM